jgi:hypothetical protein
MMNFLLNMDLKNLLINLAKANNKIILLFPRLKPEAIYKADSNQSRSMLLLLRQSRRNLECTHPNHRLLITFNSCNLLRRGFPVKIFCLVAMILLADVSDFRYSNGLLIRYTSLAGIGFRWLCIRGWIQ